MIDVNLLSIGKTILKMLTNITQEQYSCAEIFLFPIPEYAQYVRTDEWNTPLNISYSAYSTAVPVLQSKFPNQSYLSGGQDTPK